MADIYDNTKDVTIYDEAHNPIDLATDATQQAIVDAIGQESGGTTLLSKLQEIWDKLVSLFDNGNAKIKLWDGTNQVGIDSENHIYVSGKSANGAVPSSNPVSISGIDINGNKRSLLTDITGKQYVIVSPSPNNIYTQLVYERSFTAINTGEWQEVLNYTVPDGYTAETTIFDGYSETTAERVRAITKKNFAYYDSPTNTFTDGLSCILPVFATKMYIYVQSNVGNANDTFTITYTNSIGTTNRTATVIVPKSVLAGTRIEVILQTGDFGFIDITNITHTATGQNGEYIIEGCCELGYLIMTSSNTSYSISVAGETINSGDTITLQFYSQSKTSYIRRINLSLFLIPE